MLLRDKRLLPGQVRCRGTRTGHRAAGRQSSGQSDWESTGNHVPVSHHAHTIEQVVGDRAQQRSALLGLGIFDKNRGPFSRRRFLLLQGSICHDGRRRTRPDRATFFLTEIFCLSPSLVSVYIQRGIPILLLIRSAVGFFNGDTSLEFGVSHGPHNSSLHSAGLFPEKRDAPSIIT